MDQDGTAVIHLVYWYWLIFGGVLVALEKIFPGKSSLWVGIAAFATGFGAILFPKMSLFLQLVLFAAVSVFSIIGGKAAIKAQANRNETEN